MPMIGMSNVGSVVPKKLGTKKLIRAATTPMKMAKSMNSEVKKVVRGKKKR